MSALRGSDDGSDVATESDAAIEVSDDATGSDVATTGGDVTVDSGADPAGSAGPVPQASTNNIDEIAPIALIQWCRRTAKPRMIPNSPHVGVAGNEELSRPPTTVGPVVVRVR